MSSTAVKVVVDLINQATETPSTSLDGSSLPIQELKKMVGALESIVSTFGAPRGYTLRRARLSKAASEPAKKEEPKEPTPEEMAAKEKKAEKSREKRRRRTERKNSAKEEEAVLQEAEVKTEPVPVQEPKTEQEPIACDKCFRTSQHCEVQKEKLREERSKTKALKKENTEMMQREMEKDQEILQLKDENRQLKDKLAALEALLLSKETQQVPKPQPVRYLTPTSANSATTTAKITELQHIKDSIPKLQAKATEKANKLMEKAKDETNKKMAQEELDTILEDFHAYYVSVEKKLDWIHKNPSKPVNQLLPLREAPKFSDNFEKIYNAVVNGELEEDECMICIDPMDELKETVKCTGCNRRYHKECAWDWCTKGRDQCPTCPMKFNFDL